MKITGPLAGPFTPTASWERWIRPLVFHSVTMPGMITSQPIVIARTELVGFPPGPPRAPGQDRASPG